MSYESMEKAGYEFVRKLESGEYLLRVSGTDDYEVWFANKNHASYGIKYKNTHLEFARSYQGQPITRRPKTL